MPIGALAVPESAYCMERTMDLIARELDLDPVEVRRKNFIAPDAFPYQTPTGITYDSGDYEKSLDRALELSDYYAWREQSPSQQELQRATDWRRPSHSGEDGWRRR